MKKHLASLKQKCVLPLAILLIFILPSTPLKALSISMHVYEPGTTTDASTPLCGSPSQPDYGYKVDITAYTTDFVSGEDVKVYIKFQGSGGAITNIMDLGYISAGTFAHTSSWSSSGSLDMSSAPANRDSGTLFAEVILSSSGAHATSTFSVTAPFVTISPSSASINTITGPTSVSLTASASSSSTFTWSPSSGLNTTSGTTVTCSAGTSKTYTVTATSTTLAGCTGSGTVAVTVTGPCCPSSVTFTNQIITNTSVTNYIAATGTSSLAPGSNITVSAGNYIEFDPNVVLDGTSPNTALLATISPCTYNTCRLSQDHNPSASIINTNNYSNTDNVRIYPNPSSGIFTVNSDNPIDAISVMNSLGAAIVVKPGLQIDLSNQPEGIYFISVSYKGKTEVKKVFKSK